MASLVCSLPDMPLPTPGGPLGDVIIASWLLKILPALLLSAGAHGVQPAVSCAACNLCCACGIIQQVIIILINKGWPFSVNTLVHLDSDGWTAGKSKDFPGIQEAGGPSGR